MNSIMTQDEFGTIEYRNDAGKLHRVDGPAVIYPDGNKAWYKNGQLIAGPSSRWEAIDKPDGMPQHWVNGTRVVPF